MPSTPPDVPKEALDLIELLVHFKAGIFSQFVYKWMELPFRVRKMLSYNGAIKCRDPEDPKHYFCQFTKQTYFDPTNWVYAVTMRLMLPKMVQEVSWNNETKGDIFEAMLGLNYLVANGLVNQHVGALTSKSIGSMSAIVEEFVWHTWRLCDELCDGGEVVNWITWIIDMVAYRQMKDDYIRPIILDDSLEKMSYEPRCKSLMAI